MLGLGTPELVILALVVLLLFGGAKLPQLMRGMGEGMREFKKATRDEDDRPVSTSTPPSTSTTNTPTPTDRL